MDLYVLNQNFEAIAVLDQFESVLWADRYDAPGEFEIYTAVSETMLNYPVVNNYLRFSESDKLMIIEDIEIKTDIENGNKIKIVGRSLESILDRRYIIGQLDVSGSLQDTVKSIINTNIISPSDPDRQISNFIFKESTDESIVSLTYEDQFNGISVLEAIEKICQSADIGFKITLDNSKRFVMELYKGTDRSYSQNVLPFVVFRPSFDNIINSDYSENNSEAKTFCYVHSSYTATGSSTETEVVRTKGSGTGLLRKEVYVDSSITKDEDMSLEDYYAKLDQDASASLSERKVKKTFEGECETHRTFKYNTDFFLGDVVQVANDYGMETASRVGEFLWSISTSGVENYPKFTAIN